MKRCKDCGQEKDFNCFSQNIKAKDGLQSCCRLCSSLRSKAYYKENREEIIKNKIEYNKNNPEIIKRNKNKYHTKHKERDNQRSNLYRKTHLEDTRIKEKEKYNKDISFRLIKNMRNRLRSALNKNQKSGSAVKDLGCTIQDLKIWLEQQFYNHPKTGIAMTWENYGEWHIDHILPLSKFDLTDRVQLKKVCNWFNLRPMWAEENMSKGNKFSVLGEINEQD